MALSHRPLGLSSAASVEAAVAPGRRGDGPQRPRRVFGDRETGPGDQRVEAAEPQRPRRVFGDRERALDTELLFDFLATFAEGASLSDHAGLELALEDLLGAHVDVISRGGLKPKHAGILAAAVTL